MGADSDGEPEFVLVAREVIAGEHDPVEIDSVFQRAWVYGVRAERPGVLVSEIAGRGRWTAVCTTLARLAAFAGECDYFATTGADLLAQLPEGVGVFVDPLDEHGLPIVSHLVEPGELLRLRDQRT